MSKLAAQRIQSNLDRLQLARVAEILDEEVKRATEEKMAYSEFLDRLLGEEISTRDVRRVKTALRLSNLPSEKTLENFDYTFQPTVDRARTMELGNLDFVRRRENVILLGPPGVGKTHLACALGVRACQAGMGVYFTSLTDLVKKLVVADRNPGVRSKGLGYVKAQVLIIDEVGYLPLERQHAHLFFQLVSRRYEQTSIVLTSNKTFTEWAQVLGDPVIATAILDRLLHHAHVINIRGNSYRLREKAKLVAAEAER